MVFTNVVNNISVNAWVRVTEAARNFKSNEKGVTAVEYAIVIAGVAGIVAVIFGRDGTVSNMLTNIFSSIESNVTNNLPTANTPTP